MPAAKEPLPCSPDHPTLDPMPKTITLAQLATQAEQIATDIENAGTVYRIERPGHKSMVLVDSDYHERWRATCEFIAQHPDWERELAVADAQYRAGKFLSLETVMSELGLQRE